MFFFLSKRVRIYESKYTRENHKIIKINHNTRRYKKRKDVSGTSLLNKQRRRKNRKNLKM